MVLGIALLQLGYFWLGNPWNWVAAAAGLVLLVTAALRFCPLYRVIGVRTCTAGEARPWRRAIAALLLLGLAAGGSYASMFFTRKFFLEDFNAINHFYKQTLFLTGKAQRDEAVANLDQLEAGVCGLRVQVFRLQAPRPQGGRIPLPTLSRWAAFSLPSSR